MNFFDYLDNTYRNGSLDCQINEDFSLKLDGKTKAAHAWVGRIRKFWSFAYAFALPVTYFLTKAGVLKPEVDAKSRMADMKAAHDKLQAEIEARLAAQKAGVQVAKTGTTPTSLEMIQGQ